MTESKPRICVYAISKNEEKFVERFIRSANDSDLILIADTGSDDGTDVIAKNMGAVVHKISIRPWRFDHARNAALALIPDDIDICVSLDLDEVLMPGWREEVERLWRDGVTRLRYMFDWSNGIKFQAEKIHARHGYFWHHPCHEQIRADARISEVWASTDKLLVLHLPDETKSRGQYIDILDLSVKEDPTCPRNAFYYGRELFFHGLFHQAIEALEKYLEMPSAAWKIERSYAMRILSKCFEAIGDIASAEMWGLRASSQNSEGREAWCDLASFYYRRNMWRECYAMAVIALGVTVRQFAYCDDPEVWGPLPHDLASIAAWRLGLKTEAIEHCKEAISLDPDDQRLKTNLSWFTGEKDS